MPTSPEAVRSGLQLVTTAAVADVATVARAAPSLDAQREALFATVPLVVGSYAHGSAALALDWYEELREDAAPARGFTPSIVAPVREDFLAGAVDWATQLADVEAEFEAETQRLLDRLAPVLQHEVAAGFRDTMTENIAEDPEAAGWRRHARDGACPFCRMLADKGAVYRAETARFAAHDGCHCLASPVFGEHDGPTASVMQYEASKKRRSRADRARLREYLTTHYGGT